MSDTNIPFATADAGLAQIRANGASAVSGMGFLISRWLVVTCAHVVNAALGRDLHDRSPIPQGATIVVTFPLADDVPGGVWGSMPSRPARILRFRPPGRLPSDDIALLLLDEAAPGEVGVTVLAAIAGPSLANNELDVFGAPFGRVLPIHFAARFSGKTSQAWVQIDDAAGTGAFVTGGFSGGRVWSHNHEAAVGMIVATYVATDQRVAFMIPAQSILDFLGDVPGEVRRVSPVFCRTWTISASLFFLLILTHFIGDRMATYPAFLALGAGNPVMNAFQRLRLSSILVPAMLLMLVYFARSYVQHPWWNRVPCFGHMREPPRPARTRFTAVLSLVFFVLLPVAAQVHFFDSFVHKGHVYIEPQTFGMTDAELAREGETCDGYCTYSKAGRMNLVTPAGGAAGGYFDNAYHYGERSPGDPKSNSATFFPIIEPMVYLISLISSLGLMAYLLWRLFSTPTRLLEPAPDVPDSVNQATGKLESVEKFVTVAADMARPETEKEDAA